MVVPVAVTELMVHLEVESGLASAGVEVLMLGVRSTSAAPESGPSEKHRCEPLHP